MSTKPQIELFLENESGTQQVAYPFVEADHISLSNGMDIDTMIRQDVSMPTVTHEDLSFKVGVGDQDVSSAIVDSSVAEMTIKGKTYQNILPEPSTHVLSNNKEMFKVNEGLDPNVEIVDGVSKSAILSGQTLVNLVQQKNMYLLFGTSGQGKVNRTITTSGTIYETSRDDLNSYITIRTEAHPLIKPNTSYTIFFEVVQNTITKNGVEYKGVTVSGYNDSYYGRAGEKQLYHNGEFSLSKGLKKIVITTPSSVASYDGLGFGFPSFVANETPQGQVFEIQNVMIIEGDYTNVDIPYFEGMASCKMPVLTTIGKNLFIASKHQYLTSKEDYYSVDEIASKVNTVEYALEPNSQYILSFDKYGTNECWISVTINEIYSNNNNTNYSKTFTTTSTGKTTIKIASNGLDDKGNTISNIMLRKVSDDASYEPYKSNILTVNEPIELRGVGEVKDELNLMTGEVTERIGEIVLDGSENWIRWGSGFLLQGYLSNPMFVSGATNDIRTSYVKCDRFPSTIYSDVYGGTSYGVGINGGNVGISVNGISTLEAFKTNLSENPIKICYPVANKSIKTVDLSTSGNWEKVVLDGSEDVAKYSSGNFVYYAYGSSSIANVLPYASGGRAFASHTLTGSTGANNLVTNYKYIVSPKNNGTTGLCFSLDGSMTAEEAKAFLSQNPITVWYQTTTHKDSTQVKQPIFFKDGHIQLSSGADNSLIPTLDYQVKTSNSYVMDLMKTNAQYTMKAKSASGTFTIDGTSYNAGTNGTFTTPSSMTNKLLVMSNKKNTEVMILEGDVTDKTIPYFEGIKSAFEDEDKIEVLSQGKNLVDLSKGYHFASESDVTVTNNTVSIKGNSTWTRFMIPVYLKANTRYTLTYNTSNAEGNVTVRIKSDGSGDFKGGSFLNTWGDGVYYVSLNTTTHVGWVHFSNIQLIEGSEGHLQYEPYKSNNTKIPLLSPLRSLPNGVKDELIIDRANNKVALIQRIGEVVFDGSESLSSWTYNDNGTYKSIRTSVNNCIKVTTAIGDSVLVRCDKYIPVHYNAPWTTNKMVSVDVNGKIVFCGDEIRDTKTWINILKSNPTIVYYQLATPVITEVDLEGFPYVYKDGHIFLNGEVTPVTEIKYSINQQHQIEASNQDIMRHQKEIDYLYKLIGEYVRVDYKNTLLSLNLELK